jgi:beta-barrel assembly-enhancing protease
MERFRALLCILVISGLAVSPADAQKPKKQTDDVTQIGSRNVANCVNFYSLEKEMALGKQLAHEVQLQAKMADDALLTEYVNRLGQTLVRNSDAKVPFQFQVIEGETPNAFALPGGFIFVYTGLLKLASEESELAAAMAHEIAHVAARHMTCQATRSQIGNIAMIPLSVLLGGLGGYAVRQGASTANAAMFLKFGRKDETEADYLGVQYLYAAGYDPTAAITIFEKMESLSRKRPGVMDKIFSTHPMDADRIQKTEKEISQILPERPQYVINTSEYTQIRERMLRQQAKRSPEDSTKPVLRRSTATGESSPTEDRPTIKRLDLIE